MAWSEADQNPNTRPPSGYGMPTYADTLNSYAYGGMGGGSSFTPSSTTTTTSGQRNYAQELGSTANQSRKASTTSRALQQSATRTQPRSAPAADGSGYVVRRGDNLTKIGQRFGMSPTEIARANNIRNPNRISAGQRLTIPGGGGAAPRPAARGPGTAPATDQAPTMGGGYVVKRGDNLTRIAQQYGVSVQDIAQANGIRNPNRLSPGQRLNIPGAAARPEVNMPTPRMRPQQWNMQPDPGRFEDAIGGPQRPPARTVPQDAPRLNIDGALANIDSERNALNAADRRRMMESEAPQPAYRGPNVDSLTRVDERANYVNERQFPTAYGEQPQPMRGGASAVMGGPPSRTGNMSARMGGPPSRTGNMSAAMGGPPAPAIDPAQQMASLPDRMQYDDLSQSMALARARADANYYRNQQNIMQAPPQGRQPAPQPQPIQQPLVFQQGPSIPSSASGPTGMGVSPDNDRGAGRRAFIEANRSPTPIDSDTGVYMTDPRPQQPEEINWRDQFNMSFSPGGPGMIADQSSLQSAFDARQGGQVPPGPPVFVTPSGVRVWAAR